MAASDGGAAGAERAPSDAIVLQDLTQIARGKPFVHRAMWNACRVRPSRTAVCVHAFAIARLECAHRYVVHDRPLRSGERPRLPALAQAWPSGATPKINR